MPSVVEGTSTLRSEVSKLRETVTNDKANFPILSGVQEAMLVVRESVAEL